MANASAKCQGLSRARKVLLGTSARSRPSLQAPPSPVLLQTLLRAWAPLSRARRSVFTPSEFTSTQQQSNQQYQACLRKTCWLLAPRLPGSLVDFGLRLQANDGAMLDLQGLLTSDEQVAIVTISLAHQHPTAPAGSAPTVTRQGRLRQPHSSCCVCRGQYFRAPAVNLAAGVPQLGSTKQLRHLHHLLALPCQLLPRQAVQGSLQQ